MITVHRILCGCCSGWVGTCRSPGFVVEVLEPVTIDAVKARLGVPDDLGRMSIRRVSGYIVEGTCRPRRSTGCLQRAEGGGTRRAGHAGRLPGMEGGSPEPYEVVLFGADGRRTTHGFSPNARSSIGPTTQPATLKHLPMIPFRSHRYT